jgi:hypothetical protein
MLLKNKARTSRSNVRSRFRTFKVGGLIDPQAQAFIDRMEADGAIISNSVKADINKTIKQLKTILGTTDIHSRVKSMLIPHWGNKNATGTGQTAGGRACSKIYNLCGAVGDVVQNTATAQPLLLRHTGQNYAYIPDFTTGFNHFTTPSSAANTFTNKINIVAYVSYLSRNTIGVTKCILGKGNAGNNDNYALGFQDRTIRFVYRDINAGVVRVITSSNLLPTFGTVYTGWVGFTFDTVSGNYTFRLSNDSVDTDINSINWTTNESGVAQFPVPTLHATPDVLCIGALMNVNSVTRLLGGYIYRVVLSEDFNGTVLVDFNPNEYNRANNQNSWVSATGETWTISTNTNTTGLKATVVDKTMIQGDGTSYGMQAPSLNINEGAFTIFIVFRKFSNSNSAIGVLTELSNNFNSNQGFSAAINDLNNSSFSFGVNANVGQNVSSYNNSNLNVQIIMGDWDFSRPNPETLLYSNNVAATTIQQFAAADNTGNMNGTGYNILARNNAGLVWSNTLFLGDIVISGILTTAERTAIYNLLKTKFNL